MMQAKETSARLSAIQWRTVGALLISLLANRGATSDFHARVFERLARIARITSKGIKMRA